MVVPPKKRKDGPGLGKVLDDFQHQYTRNYWENCTFSGRIGLIAINTCLLGFAVIVLFLPEKITYEASTVYTSNLSVSKNDSSTGGPDYQVLGDTFSQSTEKKEVNCDNGTLNLSNGSSTLRYNYDGSYSIGSSFELQFSLNGGLEANVAFARADLYELVFGDDGLGYVSLKDLRKSGEQKFINLYSLEYSDYFSSRYVLDVPLASEDINDIRVDELIRNENILNLRVTVGDEAFISDDIYLEETPKTKKIYLAILKGKEDISINFGDLRLCQSIAN